MLRRTLSSIGVLVFVAALATAPMAASPAFAKAKSHPTHGASVKPGECGAITKEQAQSTKLGTSFASALSSGNFSKIKAALLAEFGQLGSAVARVNGFLSGAPANVKAAFGTILGQFNSLKGKIQASSNLQQLEAVFTSFGSNPKLAAASRTLSSYFGARCGVPNP
ncbi:MAG: hypothetical protein ACRDV6_00825 [Acidimicrobiales bacterium]